MDDVKIILLLNVYNSLHDRKFVWITYRDDWEMLNRRTATIRIYLQINESDDEVYTIGEPNFTFRMNYYSHSVSSNPLLLITDGSQVLCDFFFYTTFIYIFLPVKDFSTANFIQI